MSEKQFNGVENGATTIENIQNPVKFRHENWIFKLEMQNIVEVAF